MSGSGAIYPAMSVIQLRTFIKEHSLTGIIKNYTTLSKSELVNQLNACQVTRPIEVPGTQTNISIPTVELAPIRLQIPDSDIGIANQSGTMGFTLQGVAVGNLVAETASGSGVSNIPVEYEEQISKREKVNKSALEYIIKMWDVLNFRASTEADIDWDPRKVCKDYLVRLNKSGELNTFYRQKNKQGRFFAVKGLSLQSLPREVRHTIAMDYYWDIDFVNCHPALLSQYCNKKGITCIQLEQYISNRDALLRELIDANPGYTKDKAKQIVLSVMNGGEKDYNDVRTKPAWLRNFYYEIRAVITSICSMNTSAFEARKQYNIKHKRLHNHEGSYINTLLCSIENDAVLHLDKFLTSRGYRVDVLVFDGVMVFRKEGQLLQPELLTEASSYIYSKIGYLLQIVEKPMDSGFVVQDSFMSEYATWKLEFEKYNCKIKNMSCYLEVDTKDRTHIYRTEKVLLEVYKNCDYIKDWITDPQIKTYRKLDFLPYPLVADADVYNTFSGFAVNDITGVSYCEESIKPILKHISYLVNHNEDSINYFINWLANLFQYPARPTYTAIIIKSKEGVGKNILFNFIKSILGAEYCISTADPEKDCFGQFNNLLINKLLINMNETKQEDTAKYIELIKSYITEDKIQVKLKGRDSITINNFMRWIFYTNRELPFKLTKGQRRFWGVEADSSIANNRDYMTNLVNTCSQKQVQFSFYTYLMNRDISTYDFINDRPVTSLTTSMVSAGSDKIQEFIDHLKDTRATDIAANDNVLIILCNTLYKDYCNFLVDSCEMEKVSITAFGLALKNYEKVKKVRTTFGIQIHIDYN